LLKAFWPNQGRALLSKSVYAKKGEEEEEEED
jgi:hypothetical protein